MTGETEIIPLSVPRGLRAIAANAPSVFLPNEKTAERFFGFFTSNLRNKNTRRAAQAGIKNRIGNHSMRGTGITDYLKNDGSLSEARKMANHADTRTTQLYDRRGDTASLDEYSKVGI
jgi:site-specific recombinase XerD